MEETWPRIGSYRLGLVEAERLQGALVAESRFARSARGYSGLRTAQERGLTRGEVPIRRFRRSTRAATNAPRTRQDLRPQAPVFRNARLHESKS